MIAVAAHPFRHVVLPLLHPVAASSGKLSGPLVVKFVDHKYAVFVAQVEERLAVGVMGSTHMVKSEIFEQFQPLLHGLRIGGGSERTEGMVVGDTLKEHLTAIQLKAEFWRKLN